MHLDLYYLFKGVLYFILGQTDIGLFDKWPPRNLEASANSNEELCWYFRRKC
jgi:hypothetical protein